MSWQALEEEAAELAAFGARRLTESGVAYLATVDESGAPRIHPVTPIVAPGHLFVFMEPDSPKGRDLERGSRYALHCAVEDSEGGGGEFRVAGPARRVDDPRQREVAAENAPYSPSDRYVLFELFVEDSLRTTYADDGTPVRQRWRAEAQEERGEREQQPPPFVDLTEPTPGGRPRAREFDEEDGYRPDDPRGSAS